jgi:hypothetical protein
MKKSLRVLRATTLGLIPFFVLGYPILFGLIAYGVCSAFRISGSGDIAIRAAYFSLVLLPLYIFGNAWLASTEPRAPWPSPSAQRNELTKNEIIEIWKTCQSVQMHFNGIELQIRNYAVTLLVAVIGAAAYALKEHLEVNLGGHKFSMAIAIFPAGILGWFAFYFMDRHWYHRLLLGAVRHTLGVEKKFGPELELSGAIGDESPITFLGVKIHSSEKIDLFYAAGLTFFVILTGMVLVLK